MTTLILPDASVPVKSSPNRRWRLKHLDEQRRLGRERERRRRSGRTPEEAARDRELRRTYRKSSPVYAATVTRCRKNFMRKHFFRYRASQFNKDPNATGTVTALQLMALWHRQRGLCALSGRRLDRSAHLDHVVARARGGPDCVDNLRWTCPAANFAKRDMADPELLQLCRDITTYLGGDTR